MQSFNTLNKINIIHLNSFCNNFSCYAKDNTKRNQQFTSLIINYLFKASYTVITVLFQILTLPRYGCMCSGKHQRTRTTSIYWFFLFSFCHMGIPMTEYLLNIYWKMCGTSFIQFHLVYYIICLVWGHPYNNELINDNGFSVCMLHEQGYNSNVHLRRILDVWLKRGGWKWQKFYSLIPMFFLSNKSFKT